jgi:hypothetical protein
MVSCGTDVIGTTGHSPELALDCPNRRSAEARPQANGRTLKLSKKCSGVLCGPVGNAEGRLAIGRSFTSCPTFRWNGYARVSGSADLGNPHGRIRIHLQKDWN